MCLAAKMALDAESNSLSTHFFLIRMLQCKSTPKSGFSTLFPLTTTWRHDLSGLFQPSNSSPSIIPKVGYHQGTHADTDHITFNNMKMLLIQARSRDNHEVLLKVPALQRFPSKTKICIYSSFLLRNISIWPTCQDVTDVIEAWSFLKCCSWTLLLIY